MIGAVIPPGYFGEMMLKTLPLYVLRELGKALGLSIMIFSFIMLAFYAGQLMSDGAGMFTIITMIPNLFPLVSPLVLPLTILTGTLICYSRMSGTNEFTAAMAGGVHPGWLATPGLSVAILASIITLFLNSNVLDMATENIEKAIYADMTDILRRKLQKPGSIPMDNRIICRMKSHNGMAGIDITEFDTASDKAGKGQKMRWDPRYPYQKSHMVARDHSISLREENGVTYIIPELQQGVRYYLRSRPIREEMAEFAPPRWPITRNSDVRVSKGRLANAGINTLLLMRLGRERELSDMVSSVFRINDVKNWIRLGAALDNTDGLIEGTPAADVWGMINGVSKIAIHKAALAENLTDENKMAIVDGLNNVLRISSIFRPGVFDKSALPEKTADLLSKEEKHILGYSERIRLNRFLLDHILSAAVEPSREVASPDLEKSTDISLLPEVSGAFRGPVKDVIRSYRKQTAELHLRLCLSFSCIAFALVGIPLGLRSRKKSATSGFAYGIVIAVAFFLVVKGVQAQVRAGNLDWWSIWTPNLVMFAIGVYLWHRAWRID